MFVDFYRDFIFYLEIIAAIVAIITYKKYRFTESRYFLYLLLITVLVETVGLIPFYNYYYPNHSIIRSLKSVLGKELVRTNIWLYNIFKIITYFIYLFFFYKILSAKNKKIALVLLYLFLLFALIDVMMNLNTFNSKYIPITRISGALIYMILSFLYFAEVMGDDRILTFHKTLPFWIIIGALIFNLATVPIFIFSKQLDFSQQTYRVILNLSNIILYGSFITGFITNARVQKGEKAPQP
ncbi:hypothetical protein MQE36_14370 [Zhouia spongiae]|uniref:Uncharacterized protein n=1 Tax=Zhouia spongiae TaxID=2202721 RepID=A0ABY3YKY2_9FLAO|nr:hypothetical protein [Zhouia spongiae]UNY98263.1 hypothetical protein MQE36_14370 [Zhouia spongiae]